MSDAGTADAVVIGAGVIGSAVALELARAGGSVVVVDKGPAAGAGSTSSSSAVIRYTYSTWDGVVAAWESHFLWEAWAHHLGVVDPDGMARFFKVGMVILEMPGLDMGRIRGLLARAGVPFEDWDAAAIRARVPALDAGRFWPPRLPNDAEFWADPAGELSAFFTPDAGFVDDPQLAAHNLMVAAKAQGAEFRFRQRVVAIETAGDRVSGVALEGGEHIATPVVVNAAGPYSATVNELAGVLADFNVRTRALRQEVHAVEAPPSFTVDDRGAVVADGDLGTYFRPHPGGTVIVGGVEAECDPLIWIDDPDTADDQPTVDVWEAQVFRLARRLPELKVPPQPRGLAALYDVSDDWIPIYDRTALDGFYVAIGTSGNQFKNAPMAGRFIAALVDGCENGHDHDRTPVQVACPHSGHTVDLGHYSRLRAHNPDSSNSVWG
ncbi:MAG TPA: FAD-dependent oxidoreductase [Acidimicrobiales bacterium]|nr:FAD-dependent oxidoreductase [Acidimicrobiales bacterium]